MNQYLTNTVIKHKNEYIDSLFYIHKGIVLETKTNKIYLEHSYIFLEYIYDNTYSLSDYVSKTKVVGYWIKYTEIDLSFIKILSNHIKQISIHNELLKLTDPLIKISRYLYYECLTKNNPSFYIQSLKELSLYLNIELSTLSKNIQFLINKEIISKHNRLINILKTKSLEDYAFLLDY